jgi:hypothetical protein
VNHHDEIRTRLYNLKNEIDTYLSGVHNTIHGPTPALMQRLAEADATLKNLEE